MLYVHDFTKGLWLNTIVYNQDIKNPFASKPEGFFVFRSYGREARHRSAKPFTPVQIWLGPPKN